MSENKTSVLSSVQLEEYRYHLPNERIARYPLSERDKSKLLLYRQGAITHQRFFELPELLPQDSLLVFNNTKVIPARLIFKKETGAIIELFLLQPTAPSTDLQLAMAAKGNTSWQCMIGNRKRWKQELPMKLQLNIEGKPVMLKATLQHEQSDVVNFEWTPAALTFAEIIEAAGAVPLPPYLKRKPETEDKERYQTVYSNHRGAVAAPTAGLHFTPALLQQLKQTGIETEALTLHVGAGTFQPIKETNLANHPMHREQMVITASNIKKLLEHKGRTIAVGTTSMRSLESLYWYGVKLLMQPGAPFFISKEEAYQTNEQDLPSRDKALKAVLKKAEQQADHQIKGETEIFIVPGYNFKICQGLITNFHQPESTLMLLVAAFVGNDWKQIYSEALANNYRFLSYGDSSLLLPPLVLQHLNFRILPQDRIS